MTKIVCKLIFAISIIVKSAMAYSRSVGADQFDGDFVTFSTAKPPTPLFREKLLVVNNSNALLTSAPVKTSPLPPQSNSNRELRSIAHRTTKKQYFLSSTTPMMMMPASGIQFQSPQLLPHQYVKQGRMTDEQRLTTKLFSHYDRYARPVRNNSDLISISMSLTITQIFELDEIKQVLITNAWANFEWKDEFMQWNPADYSNLKMVRMLSSKLWLPDIVLYNNAADFSPTEVSTRAMVNSNGSIFWSVPNKFFSSCKIDVTYFPFDEQLCLMKFGSWTWDGFKLDLINSSTTADLVFYVKSGEWDLIAAIQRRNVVSYSCCIEPYPDVTFYVHIRRKSLYYLINVFVPCFLMSGLTLLVFQLPVESGEKCGLGITIMLSFAMFMLIVIGKLPETSESFPLISIYLTVVLSIVALSICCTVGILNLDYRSSDSARMPRWLSRFLNFVAPFCCVHDQSKRWVTTAFPTIVKIAPSEFLQQLSHELNELTRCQIMTDLDSPEVLYHNFIIGINRIVDRHIEQAKHDRDNADWRRLAQYIDRSLFWLLVVIVIVFTLWVLVLYVPGDQLVGEYRRLKLPYPADTSLFL